MRNLDAASGLFAESKRYIAWHFERPGYRFIRPGKQIPALAANFNAETLTLPPQNKAALQERVGLASSARRAFAWHGHAHGSAKGRGYCHSEA